MSTMPPTAATQSRGAFPNRRKQRGFQMENFMAKSCVLDHGKTDLNHAMRTRVSLARHNLPSLATKRLNPVFHLFSSPARYARACCTNLPHVSRRYPLLHECSHRIGAVQF